MLIQSAQKDTSDAPGGPVQLQPLRRMLIQSAQKDTSDAMKRLASAWYKYLILFYISSILGNDLLQSNETDEQVSYMMEVKLVDLICLVDICLACGRS
jgi:hypothetical protein